MVNLVVRRKIKGIEVIFSKKIVKFCYMFILLCPYAGVLKIKAPS